MFEQLSKAQMVERVEMQLRARQEALNLLCENTQLQEKLKVLELRLENAEKELQSLRISEHWNGITH